MISTRKSVYTARGISHGIAPKERIRPFSGSAPSQNNKPLEQSLQQQMLLETLLRSFHYPHFSPRAQYTREWYASP